MVKVVAQRGPLGVNVNSILWHDYVSEYFRRKKLPLFRTFGQNLQKFILRNFPERETRKFPITRSQIFIPSNIDIPVLIIKYDLV